MSKSNYFFTGKADTIKHLEAVIKSMKKITSNQDKKVTRLQSLISALENNQTISWQPISTAPKDNEIIDIWSKANGRLTDYYRSKRNDGSSYYYPANCGVTFVTDATHWMPIVSPS